MSKSVRTLRERIYGALGMRPATGWTASELVKYLGRVNYKSVTAHLSTLQNEGFVRKLTKRNSTVTDCKSFAYTRA